MQDETASIDLSMTFFATVLVLVAFVTFNMSPVKSKLVPSLSQSEGVLATPATWSPVARRGHFAVQMGERLTIFDLGPIIAGMVDIREAISSDKARQSYSAGNGDPAAFSLTLTFDPGAIVPEWTWAEIDLASYPPEPCPELPRPLVTVWTVADDGRSLRPLLDWGARCEADLRIEVLPMPNERGTVARRIELSGGMFTSDMMFR